MLAVDDRHVAFCEYNGSVARIICVAVATLANEKLLERASNGLFPVVISVEITLSGSYSGNSFEFSHRLTGFLNYALFCLRLNLKPVNYLTTRRSSMTNSRSP